MPRSVEARIATAERRANVVEMRREKMTWDEIGKALGVSMQRAHQIYLDALRDIPAKQVDQHRAEAAELAATAIDDLLLIAREHNQPRTSVEAWSSVRGWADFLATVLGTKASTKVDATVSTAPEAPDIVRLVEIAKAQADAAKAQLDAS